MAENSTWIADIFKSIIEHLVQPSEQVSAAILMFITVGLVALLFSLTRGIYDPKNRDKIENIRNAEEELTKKLGDVLERERERDSLRKELDNLREAVSKAAEERQAPTLEKIYLNLNGVANAGLMLCISLLLYEFFTLPAKIESLKNSRTPAKEQLATLAKVVSNEVSLLMFTVVTALLLSTFVLAIGHLRDGKPIEVINRAFLISLVIGAAAFGLFVSTSLGMLS
jgi:ABC-type multidrug transport system fused ATPase/permease subunit